MAASLEIASKLITDDEAAFIIAEIGQNHQGDITTAKKLITVAKECGADCVKFQKTCIEEKFNKNALKRPYCGPHSWGSTYGQHKQHLEFSHAQYRELKAFADNLGVIFSASAMDLQSLFFLQTLEVPFIKIGSGDSNNLLLIKEASMTNIPLVISTGMQDLEGVKKIYNTVSSFHKKFALLHCVSSYPASIESINLRVIELYKREFPDVVVGYSGHELGTYITTAAVTLGAKIIERHITLDKMQKGSDHQSSLDPEEFKSLIKQIRDIEIALGKPVKNFQASEMACFEKLGKTVVAAKSLTSGHVLKVGDLKVKVAEPKGIDGSLFDTLIGKTLTVDVGEDESIVDNYVQ